MNWGALQDDSSVDDETFVFGSFQLIPAQRLPVVEQHSLRRDQPERSEGEGLLIHRENRPGNVY